MSYELFGIQRKQPKGCQALDLTPFAFGMGFKLLTCPYFSGSVMHSGRSYLERRTDIMREEKFKSCSEKGTKYVPRNYTSNKFPFSGPSWPRVLTRSPTKPAVLLLWDRLFERSFSLPQRIYRFSEMFLGCSQHHHPRWKKHARMKN